MRAGVALAGLLVAGAVPVAADATAERVSGWQVAAELMSPSGRTRRAALAAIREVPDRGLLPGLVDALFFTPRERRRELLAALAELADASPGDGYQDWAGWLLARPSWPTAAGYAEWKRGLFARIDPAYRRILDPDLPRRIRLEEVLSGGVRVGGIPALVDPRVVPAAEARHMDDAEIVFGAAWGGATRAYPRRIVGWHEMVNDTLAGHPVLLSYCTLCESAILHSRRTPSGGAWTFGTSGLLHASNKLMIDGESLSLWSQVTGRPVIGRLAATDLVLEVLPLATTTWGEWKRANPTTTVLVVPEEGRRYGFDYRVGAADRARRDVRFPRRPADPRSAADTAIYGVVVDGLARAWPLDLLAAAGPFMDRVGPTDVVVVPGPGGAVRVFDAGSWRFRAAEGGLVDQAGSVWRIGEEALVAPGTDHPPRPRVPGHAAYWFAWASFHPQTELWSGIPSGAPGAEPADR